jgi:colanic acid/amylovoran biosynthesis protein
MGKDKKIKYYIISGLSLHDDNRGTAALGYGSFSFLKKFYKAETEKLTPLDLIVYKKPWKYKFKNGQKELVNVGKNKVLLQHLYVWILDYWIYQHFPFLSRLTIVHRILKTVSFVAAINGGDGFSDIYNSKTFKSRLFHTNLAMKESIPLIILPQTLGPFKDKTNLNTAEKILKYASKVHVRDRKFESELIRMGINFELTKDLSYYMEPEKYNIDIKPNAVGLNVSGLCFSNKFRDLSGYFDYYPQLIKCIIQHFQSKNIPIYLLSHSYNYKNPENSSDDMQASKDIYINLIDKTNVYLIDKDLTSPQTKYVISQFIFFIGTRMHANFAAIFTNTPVFGLAYSYKYEGAFDYMGLKGHYTSILNIEEKDISSIISQIIEKYLEAIMLKKQIKY